MADHPLAGWVMLVCNPVSGSGSGPSMLGKVRHSLDESGVRYTVEMTKGRWHATRIAHEAVKAGASAVVAIGGDGTFFEVVNGLMDPDNPGQSLREDVAAGLVQAGRGSDFGRSAGVPSDVDTACARLALGRTEQLDLGYVEFMSFGGKPRALYFANAAGLGFDAEVTVRANTSPRVLGGTVPYLSSLFVTLLAYRNKRISLRTENGEWSGKATSLVAANGQFFGGGMKIAPDARLTDGELEVVILGDLGKIDLVRNVPRVYDGSHVTHPKVTVMRAHSLEITSPDRLLLQADGEVLGQAPATFKIFPGVLKLIV